jgi:hypothetical protein
MPMIRRKDQLFWGQTFSPDDIVANDGMAGTERTEVGQWTLRFPDRDHMPETRIPPANPWQVGLGTNVQVAIQKWEEHGL